VTPVLSVNALTKRYRSRSAGPGSTSHDALHEVSFQLGAGELVALIGPNGAGKTTLLSIIAGVLDASAGSVAAGQGPSGSDGRREAGWGVGWVPQAPALYSKLSASENLELFARLEHVAEPGAAVAAMIEQIGLRARAHEPVARLSGGNRQRVNVAVGLIAQPPVLALDEPSAALDADQRERLWDFLATRVRAGTSVLFSTHNVSEAQRHARRVLVLADGRLLFDGAPSHLLSNGGEAQDGDLERALVRFLREREPGLAGV